MDRQKLSPPKKKRNQRPKLSQITAHTWCWYVIRHAHNEYLLRMSHGAEVTKVSQCP